MNLTKLSESLVNQSSIRAVTYLSANSSLPLEAFCEGLGEIMHLPTFVYDGENEYQWGYVHLEHGSIEINISRLHDANELGIAEYTVSLLISQVAPQEFTELWLNQILLPRVAEGLEALRGISNG